MGDKNGRTFDLGTGTWSLYFEGEPIMRQDGPVAKKEKDNRLYLRYNAVGIPTDQLVVKEEFVNKTGEMYLNCKVEYEHELWGDKKRLDIHYKVDTDIYESWWSYTENGYLVIVLNERIRELPDFCRADI